MNSNLVVTVEVKFEVLGDVHGDLIESAVLVVLAVAVDSEGLAIPLSLEAHENLGGLLVTTLGLAEASINSQVDEVAVLALADVLNSAGEFGLPVEAGGEGRFLEHGVFH